MNTKSKVSAFDRRKQWLGGKDSAVQLAVGSRESKAKNILLIPLSGETREAQAQLGVAVKGRLIIDSIIFASVVKLFNYTLLLHLQLSERCYFFSPNPQTQKPWANTSRQILGQEWVPPKILKKKCTG